MKATRRAAARVRQPATRAGGSLSLDGETRARSVTTDASGRAFVRSLEAGLWEVGVGRTRTIVEILPDAVARLALEPR